MSNCMLGTKKLKIVKKNFRSISHLEDVHNTVYSKLFCSFQSIIFSNAIKNTNVQFQHVVKNKAGSRTVFVYNKQGSATLDFINAKNLNLRMIANYLPANKICSL